MIPNRVYVIQLSSRVEGLGTPTRPFETVSTVYSGDSYSGVGTKVVKTYSRVGDARRVLGRLRRTHSSQIDSTAAVLECSFEVQGVH